MASPENCEHCYCGRCWVNGVEHRVCCNCGHRMAAPTPIPFYPYPTYPYYPYPTYPYHPPDSITYANNTSQIANEYTCVN